MTEQRRQSLEVRIASLLDHVEGVEARVYWPLSRRDWTRLLRCWVNGGKVGGSERRRGCRRYRRRSRRLRSWKDRTGRRCPRRMRRRDAGAAWSSGCGAMRRRRQSWPTLSPPVRHLDRCLAPPDRLLIYHRTRAGPPSILSSAARTGHRRGGGYRCSRGRGWSGDIALSWLHPPRGACFPPTVVKACRARRGQRSARGRVGAAAEVTRSRTEPIELGNKRAERGREKRSVRIPTTGGRRRLGLLNKLEGAQSRDWTHLECRMMPRLQAKTQKVRLVYP